MGIFKTNKIQSNQLSNDPEQQFEILPDDENDDTAQKDEELNLNTIDWTKVCAIDIHSVKIYFNFQKQSYVELFTVFVSYTPKHDIICSNQVPQ